VGEPPIKIELPSDPRPNLGWACQRASVVTAPLRSPAITPEQGADLKSRAVRGAVDLVPRPPIFGLKATHHRTADNAIADIHR